MKILIVDDHDIFRQGLEQALMSIQKVSQIMHARNAKDGIQIALDEHPDIIFMDIQMRGMDGIEATRQILQSQPGMRILALSQFDDKFNVLSMLSNGAVGYLVKSANMDEINEAINCVLNGQIYYSKEASDAVLLGIKTKGAAPFLESNLSNREMQVLNLIMKKKSTNDIADSLFLSIRTVEWHLSNLLHKTNSKNIKELIKFAKKNHLNGKK
jgi:DNA-binding NarL/FixJ family response regulator